MDGNVDLAKNRGKQTSRRWQQVLETTTSIAVLVVAVIWIWSQFVSKTPASRTVQLPSKPLSLVGAATRGSDSARVGIIEFSDYQCPFCGKFVRETLPAINEGYLKTGKVILAFRNLPLSGLHPLATKAAEEAECSRAQGHFWEAHDHLFAGVDPLMPATLLSLAVDLNLDQLKFDRCMAAEGPDRIRGDVSEAERLGIRTTPSFILGIRRADGLLVAKQILTGMQSVQVFQQALEGLLAATQSAR